MRWYLLITFLIHFINVTGFRIGNFKFAGSCIKDEPVDLFFHALYAGGVTAFWLWPNIGQWIMLGLFILANVIFFIFNYRYWIWPNEKKIAGYNRNFSDTHHIIKPRADVLVPDTFHILLFIKFFVDLIAITLYIIAV